MNKQVHNIKPVSDRDSKILILGSFPSVKSREQVFFYAHPQNRFWKILAALFKEEVPENVEDKKEFLHRNHIALWDVIESCEITGSSDSSIRVLKINDVSKILKDSKIERIFVNGKTAEKYYKKYLEEELNEKAICLPSSSPANAAYSLDKLIDCWKVVL
ncbi:MAG: DNA-deoxyinosine glycosylase [Erysipelotrichaceae bacterium]|nr:DNA-deoxyinosine glycosylase [Erysipelotrichaceae bacterium]